MKLFTDSDVREHGCVAGAGSLSISYPTDLVYDPLIWQNTGSGYGAKLPSQYKISFNGKSYRLYHTCYGNASSAWFKVKGRKIFVS